jgi:hypothetical protein
MMEAQRETWVWKMCNIPSEVLQVPETRQNLTDLDSSHVNAHNGQTLVHSLLHANQLNKNRGKSKKVTLSIQVPSTQAQ